MAIKKVQKGQTPTLLETQKANELIDKLNALSVIEVIESDKYLATVGSSKVVIEIKAPPPPAPPAPPPFSPKSLDTITLKACIDGEVKEVTFYVESVQ